MQSLKKTLKQSK